MTSDAKPHSTDVENSVTDIMNTTTAEFEKLLTTPGPDTSLMYATSNDLSSLHEVSSTKVTTLSAVTETSVLDSTQQPVDDTDANSELFSTTISPITLKDEQ